MWLKSFLGLFEWSDEDLFLNGYGNMMSFLCEYVRYANVPDP